MRTLPILVALLFSSCATVQQSFERPVAPGCKDAKLTTPLFPLDAVDSDPEVIGGLAELQKHIKYPEAAKRKRLSGQVWVDFAVNHEGCVVTAAVVETDHEELNEAAMDAIYLSRFEPAKIDGKAVATRHQLPITFRVSDDPFPLR